jgi:hypothetical protein
VVVWSHKLTGSCDSKMIYGYLMKKHGGCHCFLWWYDDRQSHQATLHILIEIHCKHIPLESIRSSDGNHTVERLMRGLQYCKNSSLSTKENVELLLHLAIFLCFGISENRITQLLTCMKTNKKMSSSALQ